MLFYRTLPVVESEIQLDDALSALPEWRLARAMSYRHDIDRYLCAKSYLILKDLLVRHFDADPDCGFSYGPFGRPFLESRPDVHFSISHCRKGVLCAVSNVPVGADIEEIQYDPVLAKSVMSDHEFADINGSPVQFSEYWTRKESFVKLLGTGIPDDMKQVPAFADNVDFRVERNIASGFVAAVASARPDPQI